jgi:hypothetical protein
MMLEVLLRTRKHLRGRCARSAHDLAREVPSSQPDEQRVEIVLDGLLVHLHTAAFAFASQLAVLQLLLSFRDAPLDLRLPESAPRQLIFGDRTLLRFGRARFVCIHPYAKYRSARAPAASVREQRASPGRRQGDPVGSSTPPRKKTKKTLKTLGVKLSTSASRCREWDAFGRTINLVEAGGVGRIARPAPGPPISERGGGYV